MIGCARGALLREVPDARDHPVEVRDQWDEFAVVLLVMTEPGVDLDVDVRVPIVGGPLTLASGRRVWAVSGRAGATASEPVEADGTWVRVYSPEADGGISPMMMVLGLKYEPNPTVAGHRT